eukprot:gene34765-13277_t
MVHNLWYANLGAAQCGLWDALFGDSEAFSNPEQMVKTMLLAAFIPAFRDLHFYLAHRFIHISFVYRYVHSLHHRNFDTGLKFECNYGTSGTPLDKYWGTFREKFGASQKYTGQCSDADIASSLTSATNEDEKAGAGTACKVEPFLRGTLTLTGAVWQDMWHAVFDLTCCFGLPYLMYSAVTSQHGVPGMLGAWG